MEGKPLYRTLAAVGFASHLLAMLVILPNVTTARGFVAVMAVVDVIGAVTVTRFPWGRWSGLACALAITLTTWWLAFSAVFGLPSVFDFVAGLAGTLGFLTALVASVLGLSSARAAKLAGPGHQRAVATVAVAVLVLGALSAVLTLTGQETVPADQAAGATAVDMKNDEFAPKDLTASTSGETKFVVHNSDRIAHTFTVKSLDIEEIVTPGSEKLVTIRPASSGAIEYVCDFHPDMKGTITVA